MDELRTEAVTDDDALASLVPAWWRLWRRSPNATPFQTPAWLVPWWRSFRPGSLRSVAIWGGRELVAFGAFYEERGPSGRRLLPLGISVSDYLDVLVDPLHETRAAPLLLANLLRMSSGGLLRCEELAPDATALRLWAGHPGSAIAPQSTCPVLELKDERTLKSSVPASKLRKIRMAGHRLQRRGGIVENISVETAKAFLPELLRLHFIRWKDRGEHGVLADAKVQTFHAAALVPLLKAGLLCLCTVRIESRVVAAYYGFCSRRNAYAYLGGFDPAFAYESPGTILIAHAIAEADRSGAQTFHFLRGREAYKYEWGASDRINSSLELRANE